MLRKFRLNFKKAQKEAVIKKRTKNNAMWEMLYSLEGSVRSGK